MTENAVTIEGVARRFGRTDALSDISFEVAAGSITGLLGRNGAGKTTLMSIIAGHDRADAGSVRVFGENPFENATTMASTSFVRDNQRYPDDFRLGHVLAVGRIFHPEWSSDLASELVDAFRLPSRTIVKKFSRGQLSSLGIVLGLSSRSRLTIFDEPYLGLDATARRYFYDTLMRDFIDYPRTVLVSTHLIDEMEPLLENVIVLDGGRVKRAASTDELRGTAFTLSGMADAVGSLSADLTVLRSHRVGGLLSVLVEGSREAPLLSDASRLGVEIQSATLQDLVAAYGLDAASESRIEGARP